jgi:hypothetical protein
VSTCELECPGETCLVRSETTNNSKKRLWASRILSTLPALFLLVDGGMKLFKPPVVVKSTLELGYPESSIVGIGLVLLSCTILYMIPRTAVLGAILLTGYLGGAVATQVRVSGPLFNIVFPVIFGCLLWGGLWLRDINLRRLIPVSDYSNS